MKYINTIEEYCRHINVPPPRHPDFDARKFSENMPTVKRSVAPFQHEFYAIGILLSGTSHKWHSIEQMDANIIFNSPYQLISWEIENDWNGYYVLFTQDYLTSCYFGKRLLLDFPFLKLDKVAPISVPNEQIAFLQRKFEQLMTEYQSSHQDKFAFIESYLNLILLSIKRFSGNEGTIQKGTEKKRNSDIALVTRYQSLIESRLNEDLVKPDYLSTGFYAKQLAIHPNHLNAVAKRITGKTAKQVIQEKVLQAAKSLLLQTDLSIKELAYQLGYNETTHFHNFFKKSTALTPSQFRAIGKS